MWSGLVGIVSKYEEWGSSGPGQQLDKPLALLSNNSFYKKCGLAGVRKKRFLVRYPLRVFSDLAKNKTWLLNKTILARIDLNVNFTPKGRFQKLNVYF